MRKMASKTSKSGSRNTQTHGYAHSHYGGVQATADRGAHHSVALRVVHQATQQTRVQLSMQGVLVIRKLCDRDLQFQLLAPLRKQPSGRHHSNGRAALCIGQSALRDDVQVMLMKTVYLMCRRRVRLIAETARIVALHRRRGNRWIVFFVRYNRMSLIKTAIGQRLVQE